MATFVENRKARFDYEIIDTVETGIELLGLEVKSLRKGGGRLAGAYVKVIGSELFLVGASISPYQSGNTPKDYDPERMRKLLVTKKEMAEFERKHKSDRLTLVPLKLYNVGRLIKCEIGLVRGKKKYDKRESIKKRDTEREIRRTLKN
jgi:SsrA-binding protein